MPTTSDKQATAPALAAMPPTAQRAFRESGDLLRSILEPFGYREHPDLVLDTSPYQPFLGRCFFTENRIVCLTLRAPEGNLELWVDTPDEPGDSERSLLLHFPSGFRDFQYLAVEREAFPSLLGDLQQERARAPSEFPAYLRQLLATPHLDLILRGKLWHSYFFDGRELYLGDYTMKDLADSLRKSLREQGLGEDGK